MYVYIYIYMSTYIYIYIDYIIFIFYIENYTNRKIDQIALEPWKRMQVKVVKCKRFSAHQPSNLIQPSHNQTIRPSNTPKTDQPNPWGQKPSNSKIEDRLDARNVGKSSMATSLLSTDQCLQQESNGICCVEQTCRKLLAGFPQATKRFF